ncbi:MAG: caspase family protein [Microcoleus sp. PH2017_10_PVI_O_A]|uniref:caspase family protein n=1 Tax=unclassified Microcoleus TaxID=2642155 RepID=UPI001D9A5E64|nr:MULTISPECIES: caspase family protein [unclassified Microcoleus]TAE76438.1 MAG: peptidase C14 [Oscillatoriales cyanobacterium]MCC3409292.1 caspase family protein [Microcoleus sp. PH2017_10_PVI_O_A]MCC3463525.1 caspase family protein [Microcoleus sp. PH2017_11_PCY_U_A]MCC3481879.1 caspase family protein [Microcoleus sp. PH2017_12_PCY_D_A]MCC3531806.1 caspase family protein [Microcoleus sp. PH2017_21_RUC_O_A]
MKHHACIAIGINQYQLLQPLSYAQEDAEALYGFLTEEAGFAPDGCLLMTDSSPSLWGQSTYPNRENILKLTESLCAEHLQHGDLLWCFFSGYGVSYEGKDYLMPVDGNPADIQGTGIPVELLLNTLKNAPTETVLVLVDMNRSQTVKAGETIGTQTAELARELEIPTVLSCRPNQVSRETSALRQGFFTTALLEGLRSGQCMTLKGLDRFLSDRLPELCDHHLRPKQEPLMVVNPPGKAHLVILPDTAGVPSAALAGRNGNMAVGVADGIDRPQMAAATAQMEVPEATRNTHDTQVQMRSVEHPNAVRPSGGGGDRPNSQQPEDRDNGGSDKSFLQQLILWSGATALVLLLGVFLTNKSIFIGQQEGDSRSPAENVQNPGPQKSAGGGVAQNQPRAVQAGSGTKQPPSSQQVWAEAKTFLKDGSASSFNKAVVKARTIGPSDPLYPQAQQDIERWSLTILDIANGRAARGNFSGAIGAAKLMPDVNQAVYNQSKQAIAQWEELSKEQNVNAALLSAAASQIKRGAASSYSKGIQQANKIGPGQPKHEEAQQLIGEWSGAILKIAQLRASQGKLKEAVEAASLVPSGTKSYQPAQKAIANWKTKLERQKKG